MWKSFCLPWTTSTKALPSRPCRDTPTRQQRVRRRVTSATSVTLSLVFADILNTAPAPPCQTRATPASVWVTMPLTRSRALAHTRFGRSHISIYLSTSLGSLTTYPRHSGPPLPQILVIPPPSRLSSTSTLDRQHLLQPCYLWFILDLRFIFEVIYRIFGSGV